MTSKEISKMANVEPEMQDAIEEYIERYVNEEMGKLKRKLIIQVNRLEVFDKRDIRIIIANTY